MSEPTKYTARDAATYILEEVGMLRWTHLQRILFNASMGHMRVHGTSLFDEPFYAARSGPVVKSVTKDWLRHRRVTKARRARRLPVLRRRVHLWCLQESKRRPNNISRINMPGGWTDAHNSAVRAGILDYVKHRGLKMPTLSHG